MDTSRLVPAWSVVVALLVVAVAMAVTNVPLAAQGAQLTAVRVEGAIPADPAAAAWANVPASQVPLIPQAGIPPALDKVSVPNVSVKAVHNGAEIAILMEWADQTRDASSTVVTAFRDAAAIQFPVGAEVPNVCMGAPGQITNLWHWKADWQEDIDKGYQELAQAYPNLFKDYYPFVPNGAGQPQYPKDFAAPAARAYMLGWTVGNPLSQPTRTSPVEELNAAGFGSATSKSLQHVGGKGVWANGKWQVVFVRALSVRDPDAALLTPGKTTQIAFAVWNGANQEVGARKQVSSFVSLQIPATTGSSAQPQATATTQPATVQPTAVLQWAPILWPTIGILGLMLGLVLRGRVRW
ncbi:MAG: nitrate reductase [Chloroflexi bacterium]|nr:nitrate reductase [Chloroflexota bacterium]